jgi:hypothetical protein
MITTYHKFVKPLINEIKLEKSRIRYGETYRAWEYDKQIYVVDVAGIKGLVNGEENTLLSNFWALLLGLIRDVNTGDVVDTAGSAFALRSAGDVNVGSAYLDWGTGTLPESFTQHTLASRGGSLTTTITVGALSDRSRISLLATTTADTNEFGVVQQLYDTGGGTKTVLLARKVASYPASTPIVYTIDFLEPWLIQTANYLYGIFLNRDVANTRIDGVGFTHRTSGDSNAGAPYLVISTSEITWSPTLYNIPSPISVTMFYSDILSSRLVRGTILTGILSPASDLGINTIGLYQPVFDTAGASQTICHMAIKLPSPITFYANRNNIIMIRIIAF